MSLSGHKIHAPKGIGAMYMRNGINLPNLIHGGAQERTKRAGTENVPSIVALGVAITDAVKDIPAKAALVGAKRDRLISELLKIKESRLERRRCKTPSRKRWNISFRGIEGESLLLSLDLAGIAASSGSACTSGSLDPSHVLLAIASSPRHRARLFKTYHQRGNKRRGYRLHRFLKPFQRLLQN